MAATKAEANAIHYRAVADASEARDSEFLRSAVDSLTRATKSAKTQPSDVGYLDQSPRDDQSCQKCTMFQPGTKFLGACDLVAGSISPRGWCWRYDPR